MSHLCPFTSPELNSETHTAFSCHAWVGLIHLRLFLPSICAHPAKNAEWPPCDTSGLLTTAPGPPRIPTSVRRPGCASTYLLQLSKRAGFSESQTEAVPFHSSNNARAEQDRPHLSDPAVSWSETGARYSSSLPLHVYKQLRDSHRADWPDWLSDWNFSHANYRHIEENSAKRKFCESKTRQSL